MEELNITEPQADVQIESQVEQTPTGDGVSDYFNEVVKPANDFSTEEEFRDVIKNNPDIMKSYWEEVAKPRNDFSSFEEFSSFLNVGGVGKPMPPIQTNIGGAEQKPTTLKPATQSPLKSSGIQSLSERLIKTPSSYYTQKVTEDISLGQARYVVSSLGYSMNDISNEELTDVLANKKSYKSLGHMVDDVKGRIAQNRQRQAEEPVQPEEGRVTKTTKTVLGKEVKKEPMVMAPKDPFGFESVIKEVESPERPKASYLQSYDNDQQATIDAEREMLRLKQIYDNPYESQRHGTLKKEAVRREELASYERAKKDFDRLNQRSSKSLEDAKPIIDNYTNALTDGIKWQSFKNKEGDFDIYKANDAAKKIAVQNGFRDDGPAVKYIESQIISKAQFKEKEPEILARYAEKEQEILGGLDADQTKIAEEFKGVSKTLAETSLQIEGLGKEISTLVATEADPIRKDYELSTSDIKTGYAALDQDLQNQLSQNAQLYNSGQRSFQEATQFEQQLNAQREELLNQTNIELGNQFDLLTARLNEVNSKYKQRYERQKNEISSAAEAKFQKEFQQFAKDKNLTQDAMIKLKAAYKDAYDATMLADKEKRQAFEKEIGEGFWRVPEFAKFGSALFSQDGGVFDITDLSYLLPINTQVAGIAFENSLGTALEAIGNEMGFEALRIGGRQMALSSDLLAPKEEISWGDLTDWISFQKSAGNLAGSMAPGLLATAAATAITGGLGVGTIGTMTIGGLVGWQTESMQMASQVYLDTLKETGDAVLAQRRADKMWDFQKSIILSYGLEALPFMGILRKGTSQIGRRIILGAAAELGTETVLQEFPQTVAEEAIMRDKDAMTAIGEAFKGVGGYLASRVGGDTPTEQEVKDYQLFKRVVIETAPVAVLGGGGQAISSLREQRVINAAEKIGKAYMQKAVFGSVSPVQTNQFLSDLVSVKGVDFATTMVTGLFTSGQITEVEKTKMLEGISKSETIIATAKRQKMNKTEASVFSFLNFLNDDMVGQIEQESDPNVKSALESKQKAIETDLKNFLITKKSDLFVVEYADGSQTLMAPDDITTLSQNQAFINELRDGSLSIKGLSAEFTSKQKPIIDDLNARMEASKQAAPEEGLTVEEIKQGFQEQLNNVDISSPKAGQITSDIILDYIVAGNADSVEAAIDSGKPVDGKEASMLLDSLYTALARVDESVSMTAEQKADLQGILEPLISKIEGYDNITEGTTIKVAERQATARPVEDARKVKDQASAIENSRGKKGVLIRPSRRNPNQRVKEKVKSIDPATIPIESEVSIVRDDAGEIVGYSFTLPDGNELFVDDPGGGIDLALMQKNEIMGAPPQLMEQVFEDVMREVEVTAPTTKTETTKPTENAVQEQAAGQVPVQPEAGVSETMAEGKPETEPQVTPTEGQAEQAKAPTEEKKEVNVGDALNIINALNEQTPGQTEEAPRTYTTKNIDRAINDARKAKDAKLEKALVDAKAIMKALGKKDTKVVIHFNQGSYTQSVVQAGGEAQAFGTSGFVISKDGNTIHLNLPKIKSNEVVLHEGAHPVLDWITKNNPERIDALYTELESLAQVLPGVNDAIAFSKKYGNTTQAKKEAIVQFMALVADGTINLSEANPTFKQKAIEFIKKLLQAIGIDFGVKISDDASVTELAKRFTESVKYGREISVASKTGVATPQMMIAGVNAELAQDVRDNLQVARDMEAANKDAKTIRIATGWEKGVDGLWRYEVPDNIPYLKDTVRQVKQYLFEDEGVDDIGQKASYFLPPELIKLYPKLDEVLIFFNKRGDENVGSYDELAKIINVNIGVYPEKTVSVLLHEIQHAIQDIEGFDKGASPKDLLGTFVLKEQALLDRIKKLEGPRGGNNPTAIENAKQDYRDFVKKFGTIKDGKKILYALDLYNRKAGEVEARNVEARMKMTPEQRRATTLQETEDVARDSQIFLREGDMTTGPQFSMTEGGRVTAEDIYPGTAFEMQDAAAEDTVGRNKDNWGASQVWRERIENAGDILRELSGRVNPDPVYILEKLNKLKNWIEQGKKNPTDKIPTYINTLDDFNKTNLRFTNIVDGYEYLTKFNSDVLEKVKREYNAIHTYTKEQRLALDLVIDLLENNINGVENKISSLEKIVEKAKQDKKLDQTVDIKLGSTTGPQFSMAGAGAKKLSNEEISNLVDSYRGDTDELVKFSDTVSIQKSGNEYRVTAMRNDGVLYTFRPMNLAEAKIFAENQLYKENAGSNINPKKYSPQQKRAQDLKIGDIYTRIINGSRYVFQLMSDFKKDRIAGQFFNADVKVLDVGNQTLSKELSVDGKIKTLGFSVGQTTIDRFKNMDSPNGFNLGEVTVINDFESKTPTGPQFSMAGGVPISDVITALRNAGATEQVIADALKQSGYYTQEEINDAMGLPAPQPTPMIQPPVIPPPSGAEPENGTNEKVRSIYERMALKAESEGNLELAAQIRDKGLYEQRPKEQVEAESNLLISSFNDDIEAAADFVMNNTINGDIRTNVLGKRMTRAKEAALSNRTVENLATLEQAIYDFAAYSTDLGQAVNEIKNVEANNPELFYLGRFSEYIATLADNLGNPAVTTTNANKIVKAAKDVVKLRKDILNKVANVISEMADDATIDSLMIDALELDKAGKNRVLTNKMRNGLRKIVGSVESKKIIGEKLKRLAELGVFGLEETRDEVKELIRKGLAEINPTLQTPLDTSEIQEMAEMFMIIYEEMATQKMEGLLDKAFNGNNKNNAAVTKAVMYGALDTPNALNKFAQKFGLSYITPQMQQQLKNAAQKVANAKGNTARSIAQAAFTTMLNKFIYQTKPAGYKILTSSRSFFKYFANVYYNTALFAFNTFFRAFQGNTLRTLGNVLYALTRGEFDIVKDSFRDVYFRKKVAFNYTDRNGVIRSIDAKTQLVFDDIYSSLRGLPRLAEVKREGGLTQVEIDIRNTDSRLKRRLLRTFAVPASRIMGAVDASVMPLNMFLTKRQAFYEVLKAFYKDKGITISKKTIPGVSISEADLRIQLNSILGVDTDYVSKAMEQAVVDVMGSKLWTDLGFTNADEFPTVDPRYGPLKLRLPKASRESKIYNEFLFRTREILDSEENKRLQDSFSKTGYGSTITQTETDLMSAAIDNYAMKVSSELAFLGTPRGSMRAPAEFINGLSTKYPILKYIGLSPLFTNAAFNSVSMAIRVAPGFNIIQYLKYWYTGTRGGQKKGQKEFGADYEQLTKIDQNKMLKTVLLTNALFLVATALKPYDDKEEEKKAIDDKTWTGSTPLKLTKAQTDLGYLPGRIYIKGEAYDYRDNPLALLISGISFVRNYGLWSFDNKSNNFYVEDDGEIGYDPTFIEQASAYAQYIITSMLEFSTIKDMSKTYSDIIEILSPPTGEDDIKKKELASRFVDKKGANIIRTSIPYSRFVAEMKTITDAIMDEEKKLPITFYDNIVFGHAIEDNVIKTNGYDFFGRPVKDAFTLVSPFVSSFSINQDPKVDREHTLYRKMNYTPKLFLNDRLAVHITLDDLNGDANKFEDFFKTVKLEEKKGDGLVAEVERKSKSEQRVLVSLFMSKEEANLVNQKACEFAGKFVEENFADLQSMDMARFKDAMNSIYNIGREVAIYQNLGNLIEYDKEDYYSMINDKIIKFKNTYVGSEMDNLSWPQEFEPSSILGDSFETEPKVKL